MTSGQTKIWHNPRCTRSRNATAYLDAAGIGHRQRGMQLGAGHRVLDQIPHQLQRQRRIGIGHLQHPHRRRELARAAGDPRVPAQFLLIGLPLSLGHQVVDHHLVEQVHHIIGRPRPQGDNGRDQHRQLMLP